MRVIAVRHDHLVHECRRARAHSWQVNFERPRGVAIASSVAISLTPESPLKNAPAGSPAGEARRARPR
jgi:hypothetical protein